LQQLKRTQLFETYRRDAELTEFAGFEMPLSFKGIIPEHLAVRNTVGVFDISHMGRVLVTGSDAERFLNHIITNDVSPLQSNAALYSVMCNEKGGIIDDFVSYRLDRERFLVVFNAGNREKDYNWLTAHSSNFNVKIDNVSDDVAMLAVQGPKAETTLQTISSENLSTIARFKCGGTRLAQVDVFISRTGYTGEDGFEVFVWNAPLNKPDNAVKVWNAILQAGATVGLQPCGLGARDTLRLEAGLCLYGNDIDENTSPLEAGLGFVVKLQKEEFIGKETLLKQKSEGVRRKRIGLKMVEKGIPRQGFDIFDQQHRKIGVVTSGTFSPLLRQGVGMGYVDVANAQEGSTVSISIRDKLVKGRIAAFPLYDPDRYGYKRKTPA
jgi:aminomethyltransferase